MAEIIVLIQDYHLHCFLRVSLSVAEWLTNSVGSDQRKGGVIATDSSAYPGGRWRLVSIPARWPPVTAHSYHGQIKAAAMRRTRKARSARTQEENKRVCVQQRKRKVHYRPFSLHFHDCQAVLSIYSNPKHTTTTPNYFICPPHKKKAKRTTLSTCQRGTRHLILLSLETSANHLPLSTSQLWFNSHQEARVRTAAAGGRRGGICLPQLGRSRQYPHLQQKEASKYSREK